MKVDFETVLKLVLATLQFFDRFLSELPNQLFCIFKNLNIEEVNLATLFFDSSELNRVANIPISNVSTNFHRQFPTLPSRLPHCIESRATALPVTYGDNL